MGQILMHQFSELQLKTLIEEIVREVISDSLKKYFPNPIPTSADNFPQYLTRKQAAEHLKISLPTLHAYTKQGVIKAMRLGHQVRYLQKDIDAALKEIRSPSYRR